MIILYSIGESGESGIKLIRIVHPADIYHQPAVGHGDRFHHQGLGTIAEAQFLSGHFHKVIEKSLRLFGAVCQLGNLKVPFFQIFPVQNKPYFIFIYAFQSHTVAFLRPTAQRVHALQTCNFFFLPFEVPKRMIEGNIPDQSLPPAFGALEPHLQTAGRFPTFALIPSYLLAGDNYHNQLTSPLPKRKGGQPIDTRDRSHTEYTEWDMLRGVCPIRFSGLLSVNPRR